MIVIMVSGLLPYLTIPESINSLARPALEVTIDLSLDCWVTFVVLFLSPPKARKCSVLATDQAPYAVTEKEWKSLYSSARQRTSLDRW